MEFNNITVYTDGAAKGNPGKAGWGAVIIFHDGELKSGTRKSKVVELGGRTEHATNNQMELTAPIEALLYIKNNFPGVEKVEIVSDSKYVILGITEWIHNWQKNNWRSANKKPVLNKELWQRLYALCLEVKPKWTHVKGHNDDEYNDRADLIATSFAGGEELNLKQ